MQLNLKKSCVIWFYTRHQRDQSYPDFVVDNVKLQVQLKLLGLMFDSTSDHVSRTCQKVAYYINHHKHVLPSYLITDSLVISHMQYTLSLWGPSLTQKQLLHLQRLQNHAVLLVFSLNRSDHIPGNY